MTESPPPAGNESVEPELPGVSAPGGQGRRLRIGLIAVAVAAALVVLGGCLRQQAASSPPAGRAARPGTLPGFLTGVSTGPGGTAWAADITAPGRTLILHWNGTAWSQAASPSPGAVAVVDGVAAGPGGTAWAAGRSCISGCGSGVHPAAAEFQALAGEGS